MTNKINTTDDFVNGDVLEAADLIDSVVQSKWVTETYGRTTTNYPYGVISHTNSNLTIVSNEVIRNSTDSGVTWTTRNTDLDTQPFIRKCKDAPTKAFAIEGNSATAEAAYTANSSLTWTTTTNPCAINTKIYDVSFPTTNLIVVFGDDGVGAKHVIFSVDQGNNWTDCTTSPATLVYAGDMFNGTSGLCVDDAGKIYTTPDSGVTWNNTGHTCSAGIDLIGGMSLYAISATTCLIALGELIEYYDGTGNAKALGGYYWGAATITSITKVNGVYYILAGRDDVNYFAPIGLYSWDGTGNLKQIIIPMFGFNNLICEKCCLGDIDGDSLILAGRHQQFIYKIKEWN